MSALVRRSTQPSRHLAVAKDSSAAAENHPGESSAVQPFLHRQMLCQMLTTAQQQGRDFADDVLRLITVYFSRRTINVTKILSQWPDSDPHKRDFQTMVAVYGVRSQTDFNEPHPTLARVAEALPHLSLVMCDQIASKSATFQRPWINDKELGAVVHRHFKMNYYPALVDVRAGGSKVEAGLLLANLCFAKVLMKTSKGRLHSAQAFVVACRFAFHLMAQQLAPRQSRRRFTEFAKSLPLDAHIMNAVWRSVLDGVTIQRSDAVCLTSFHQLVFDAQPLDLGVWQLLLAAIDS